MPQLDRAKSQKTSAPATVWADGTEPSSRIVEMAVAVVVGGVSGFVLVGTHRMSFTAGDVTIPWGLPFGALFQCMASLLMLAWFGRKFPLAVLSLMFALVSMWFAGPSAGGGILIPGEIAGEFQWQGWAMQLMGVLLPILVLAGVWVVQIRRLARSARTGGFAPW